MVNRKEPEPKPKPELEPQFVILAPAPGGYFISAAWLSSPAPQEKNMLYWAD